MPKTARPAALEPRRSKPAGGVPEELLRAVSAGVHAAVEGGRPTRAQLRQLSALGRRAAEEGLDAGSLVGACLGTATAAWEQLPVRAAGAHAQAGRVLQLLTDAVSALVDGHQAARQQMVRHEETVRKEFIDDLLRGDADVARMLERAQPFGLDLTRPHHVALAAPTESMPDVDRAALQLERPVVDQYGDRDVLVATKDDRVVVLVPGASLPPPEATEATLELGRFVDAQLHRGDGPRRWKVGAGRAFPGAFGVARSYEEAREILELAERLDLETLALSPGQLLLYRVLIRDQAAIIDLVHTVVGPLGQARGGAGPLLETLWTFFDSSDVATETARRMHLSVRAVTYRLAKVRELTGYNPLHPEQRFALHAAVLGARLLGWPTQPLPGLT